MFYSLTSHRVCVIFLSIMIKRRVVEALGFFACLTIFGVGTPAQSLTLADVQTIIAQAVSKAVAMNQKVTVSVSDKKGNLLGTFQMTGAPAATLIRSVGRAGQ